MGQGVFSKWRGGAISAYPRILGDTWTQRAIISSSGGLQRRRVYIRVGPSQWSTPFWHAVAILAVRMDAGLTDYRSRPTTWHSLVRAYLCASVLTLSLL